MNDLLMPPPIDPLPAAPLWERWLFEQPLVPALALVLLSGVCLAVLARRNRRAAVALAGVLLLAAGGLALSAHLVTTTRERLLSRTAQLVHAVARADASALGELLAEDAQLKASGDLGRVLPRIEGRQALIGRIEQDLGGRYALERWAVHDAQATVDGPNVARTQVRVAVQPRAFDRPHASWWRLHWTRDQLGRWRCFEIEPRWIQLVGSAR
ncbi:MAG: hypothetical protein KatS3mg103_0256 [Phycisphaerales bacterium]|nr:MAG: hypothetical protein KatS3mg103_0256 [Phycisphaerales bacterium]